MSVGLNIKKNAMGYKYPIFVLSAEISACSTLQCPENSKCVEVNGTASCQCNKYYRRDGEKCQGQVHVI